MDEEKKKERIKELEYQIINAKKNYYSSEDYTDIQMTDAEYDILESELRELDPDNKILKMVGYEDKVVSFDKVEHKVPMLSMDKAHTKEDIVKWYNDKIDSCFLNGEDTYLVIEPKIDGISGDMCYKNGKFTLTSTRGNGKIGIKIHDDFLSCIPKTIPSDKEEVHIRGEYYIPKLYNLERDKEDQEPLRNICSGALKRKEKGTIHDKVKFVAYQLIDNSYLTEEDKIKFLNETDFDVVPYFITKSIDEAWEYFEKYEAHLRDKWPYETDGLVITFNSIKSQEKIVKELGDTDHHHKYAIAIKPKPDGAWTTLNDVEWNTSRSGTVKPVGVIGTVEIGSAIVNRATLNNIRYIEINDIKQFDKVLCIRANDVIPKIVNNIHTPASKIIKLDKCPSCGAPLQMKGVDYWCYNYLECPAQRINKFIYWFKVTGIKNLGPNMIDSLISCGHFYALWELYSMNREDLSKVVEKYCNLSRDTDTMKEFLDTFEKSKDQTTQEIIGNYGIPTIGIKTLEKLKIEDLNDLIKYKDIKYLRSDVMAEVKICEWLNQDEKNFDDLFSLVKFIDPKQKTRGEKKNCKYFCITGEFKNKRRASIIKELEEKYDNWKFSSTVNKETNLLIIANESGITNKSLSAMRLKIPMLKLEGEYDISIIPLENY